MYTMFISIFFGIVCVIFFTIGVIGKDRRMIKLGMAMAVMTMIVYYLSMMLGANYAAQMEEMQQTAPTQQLEETVKTVE